MQTGGRVASKRAEDATQWMRENAPWNDRTEQERAKRGLPPHPNARESLRAYVVESGSDAENKQFRADVRAANKANERALNALNRQRGKQGLGQRKTLPSANRTAVPQKSRFPVAEVRFEHGDRRRVPYAIWLEIAHGGRYSILAPAVTYWGNVMMKDIQNIMNLPNFSATLGAVDTSADVLRGPKGSSLDDDYDVSRVNQSRLSSSQSLRDAAYTESGFRRRNR